MSKNKVTIFGIHAVESLLLKNPERVNELLILKEREDQKFQTLLALATDRNIRVSFVPRKELDRITQGEVHQGVVAYTQASKSYNENDLDSLLQQHQKPFLLILDGIQDPHNLGACLRSADAFGVHAVITPKDKSVGITPTVSKVACGAAEVIPFIQVTNLARTMRDLKDQNIWLFGAAGEASQSLYKTDLNTSVAIVMGAEGEGLRRLTREHCDMLVHIPMFGTVESLNVSVATGIFLSEVIRQRS